MKIKRNPYRSWYTTSIETSELKSSFNSVKISGKQGRRTHLAPRVQQQHPFQAPLSVCDASLCRFAPMISQEQLPLHERNQNRAAGEVNEWEKQEKEIQSGKIEEKMSIRTRKQRKDRWRYGKIYMEKGKDTGKKVHKRETMVRKQTRKRIMKEKRKIVTRWRTFCNAGFGRTESHRSTVVTRNGGGKDRVLRQRAAAHPRRGGGPGKCMKAPRFSGLRLTTPILMWSSPVETAYRANHCRRGKSVLLHMPHRRPSSCECCLSNA